MSDLETFPISIPGGINQSAPVPQEGDLEELFNFGIFRNRIGLRPPIEVIATIQDDQVTPEDVDAILSIVDHEGLMYIASWSDSQQDVYLHSCQVDGSSLTLEAVLWSGVVSKPRITLVSFEGGTETSGVARLYAVDYNQNLDTVYWNGSSVVALEVDFNADSTDEDIIYSLMIPYKFHLWGTGFYEGTTTRAEMLRFSQPGLVPSTDPAGGTNPREWWTADHRSLGRRGDKIVAVAKAGDRLLAFQRRASHGIYGSGAATWTTQEISNVVGCVGPGAVATVDDRVAYLWASDGPYRTDGQELQYIGLPVRQLAVESDASENDTLVGYSPDDGFVYFIVSEAGADNYSHGLAFDSRRERWMRSIWVADDGIQLEDSYSESNEDGSPGVLVQAASGWGQTFTTTASSSNLLSATFYLARYYSKEFPGSVEIIARVYNESNDLPIGDPIATSTIIQGDVVGENYELVTVEFPGGELLEASTTYVLTLETVNGETSLDAYSWYKIGIDSASPTHTGQASYKLSDGIWTTQSGRDICFYINTSVEPTPIEFGCLSFLDSASAPGPSAAPSSASVSATSASTALVTWANGDTNVDTETRIYRSLSSGFTPNDATNRAGVVGSGATSFNDSGLTPDTTYYYKIRHHRNSQDSSSSSQVSDKTWLATPTSVALAGLTDGLKITGVNNASGADIVIQRSTDGVSFSTVQTLSTPGATFEWSNTGLTCGVTYYYQAYAEKTSSTDSDTSTITSREACNATTAPTAPSSLTATADGVDTIDLTWSDDSDNEDAFEIQRSLTSGSGFSLIDTVASGIEAYEDTGLDSNTTYYYRVRATNNAGNSSYTSEANDTTDPDLDAPSDLAANAISTSRIDLTWTDTASDETSWEVWQSEDDITYGKVATLGAGSTSYSATGLSADETYYYKVRAVNATTNGSYSNTASDATGGSPPAQPTSFTATVNGASSTDTIDLAWTDNATGEDNYEVWRDSGGGYVLVATIAADSEAYQDTGLSESTTYTYKVRAIDGVTGNGTFSAEDGATTTGTPSAPDAPTDFVATPDNADLDSVEVSAVDLTWTDNADNEDAYIIERCQGASCTGWVQIANLPAGTESYRDTGVTDDTNSVTIYRYRIKAVNTIGDSSYATSGDISVEPQVTPSSVAVEDTSYCSGAIPTPRVTVGWDNGDVTDINERYIQRSTNGGTSWTTIKTYVTDGTATSYEDEDVAFGINYIYRVVDYHGDDGENTGTFTSTQSASISPSEPDCGGPV